MPTGFRCVAAAVVALIFSAAPAGAVTILDEAGQPLAYWQRIADFSRVTWPDETVTLRFGTCPDGDTSAAGCLSDYPDGRLVITIRRGRRTLFEQNKIFRHELGHVMIQRAWTRTDIRVFLLLWGRPRILWREPPPDPDALAVVESQDQSAYGEEWAADAIAACATYATFSDNPDEQRRFMTGREWQRALEIIPAGRWHPEVVRDRMVNTCLHVHDTVTGP